MPRLSSRNSSLNELSRRNFLKWTGAGAAALALPDGSLAGIFGDSAGPQFQTGRLAATHDLPSRPLWGPYSKKHFGISHIPDVACGLVFDFSIFPLLTNGPIQLPSVTDPSGVHPWAAAPDLRFYSWRSELIWKDQFYCDISFSQWSKHSRLIRMELVNQTGAPQEITLNCLAQLVFPPVKELTAEPIRRCAVELPAGAQWVHALNYADLQFATPRPTDHLVPDGQWRAGERRHESVGGSVVGQNFGSEAGDTIMYRLQLKRHFARAVLIWRFTLKEGERVSFQMDATMGRSVRREIVFHGSGQFDTVAVPLGELKAGECEFNFTSAGGAAVALNGFVLVEQADVEQLQFVSQSWHPIPEIDPASGTDGMILKYQDTDEFYGFKCGLPLAGHRLLKWHELAAAFGTEAGPNTRSRIFGDPRRGRAGDPDSQFIHAYGQPFRVAPHSRQIIYNLVGAGSRAQVSRDLAGFDPQSARNEEIFISNREKAFEPVATPAGEPYQFSQRLMAAATLTGLVYPLYTQGSYIRHYSPGRIWDCLYTWDAGFIGLGLLEMDVSSAVEILNAYTTPPGAQSAFIFHGSPLPIQIFLFYELWNRTQSRELLAYFYPRLRQQYLFLAGRAGGSTTRRHQDHLICTWDYFYNSGGWDDYPAQKFMHAQKLEAKVAPTVNSAHTIRCAKLLHQAARALGCTQDLAEYDEDIAVLSASLQKYSWDAASGYFGYVLHDDNGQPTGILRDEHGANFNLGLDGVYPLTAGICSPEQEQIILGNLFSPQHLWMDIGITTVDQSAPYYNPEGYWNGAVWLAHQWFLWKTMLDLNRPDLANRIAQTGLDLWKRVTDATYNCMEHFIPREPFGVGWHQFTSLSSPALSWFASLYTPGRLTCGFEVWVEDCRFQRNNRRLRATLKSTGTLGRPFSVLACMNPAARYRVEWNEMPAVFTTLHDGLLQIQLSREAEPGELRVTEI
jgi:hypothetical protein